MNKSSSEREKKTSVIQENQKHETDVGSSQVQIALLTYQIGELTEHLKKHKKDYSSLRGLLKKVNLRKKLLRYLKSRDFAEHKKLVNKLAIRN